MSAGSFDIWRDGGHAGRLNESAAALAVDPLTFGADKDWRHAAFAAFCPPALLARAFAIEAALLVFVFAANDVHLGACIPVAVRHAHPGNAVRCVASIVLVGAAALGFQVASVQEVFTNGGLALVYARARVQGHALLRCGVPHIGLANAEAALDAHFDAHAWTIVRVVARQLASGAAFGELLAANAFLFPFDKRNGVAFCVVFAKVAGFGILEADLVVLVPGYARLEKVLASVGVCCNTTGVGEDGGRRKRREEEEEKMKEI